jgi:hypothetical protein
MEIGCMILDRSHVAFMDIVLSSADILTLSILCTRYLDQWKKNVTAHVYSGSWDSPVSCLTTDWTTAVRFPAEAKGFSSSLCVQTSSETQGGHFPGVKRGQGVTLTTHPI